MHLPCDAAATLTIQCFQAIARSEGGAEVAEILEKCTLPSSHLRLTDCFLAPIRPTSPYFLRPNERKLVHCSIHPGTTSAPALDHSSLLLCLHKDLNSQLSIVSSSASADGATLILQNLSSTPFSLHPDVSLGQAMSWPIPLIAPYRLPSASPNLPWSLSSSRTGLGKTPKVQTPLQIQNLHYKTPSLLIGPDTKQGEETSLPGCHLSSGRIKEGFELWSVGMKVMEGTDGELNVVELHLGSLWRVWKPSLPLTLHIVPPGFEISSTPCLSCCSFHPWSSCPAMSSCSCPSPHTRLECSASSCWNCNDHHNWRQCPLPILTPQQLELTQLGFKFGERGITMEGTGERVKTLEEALVIMDKALAKNICTRSQIYTNPNLHINRNSKEGQTYDIFLKSPWYEDLKNNSPYFNMIALGEQSEKKMNFGSPFSSKLGPLFRIFGSTLDFETVLSCAEGALGSRRPHSNRVSTFPAHIYRGVTLSPPD